MCSGLRCTHPGHTPVHSHSPDASRLLVMEPTSSAAKKYQGASLFMLSISGDDYPCRYGSRKTVETGRKKGSGSIKGQAKKTVEQGRKKHTTVETGGKKHKTGETGRKKGSGSGQAGKAKKTVAEGRKKGSGSAQAGKVRGAYGKKMIQGQSVLPFK